MMDLRSDEERDRSRYDAGMIAGHAGEDSDPERANDTEYQQGFRHGRGYRKAESDGPFYRKRG